MPLTGLVTRGGEPVPGGRVMLTVIGAARPGGEDDGGGDAGSEERVTLFRVTRADAAGRYGFRLGPGRYRMRLYRATVDGPERFEVAAGGEPVVRNVSLDPPPGDAPPTVLTGTVTDGYGLPLAGIAVTAADRREQAARGAGVTVATDSGGGFRIERVSPNGWRRWFLLAGGYDEFRGQVAGFRDVDLDRDDLTALALPVGRVTVASGLVRNDRGEAFAGVPVELRTTGAFMQDDPPPFRFSAVTGPAGRVAVRGPIGGVTYSLAAAEGIGAGPYALPWVVPDAGAPDLGPLVLKGAGATVPAADERRAWAFAEPPDPTAALADLRATAGVLNRRVLLLVADPGAAAGRDLFAAVYDAPALAAAADAGYLTRCLQPAGPNRGAAPLPGRDGADPAAATLTVTTPDGTVVAVHRHAAGDRAALAAFLKAHAPAD